MGKSLVAIKAVFLPLRTLRKQRKGRMWKIFLLTPVLPHGVERETKVKNDNNQLHFPKLLVKFFGGS